MPKNPEIKKVLMIGSGPIVIGQAAEFDYAGTQACRSLKEEGVEVVLLNSNPATIMTDKDIADRVYIEPLTVEVVEQLILKEKPDSVLPTLGGQAGLNLAMELDEKGFLKEHNVRLIGTTAQTIKKAEIVRNLRIPWRKSASQLQLPRLLPRWRMVLHLPIPLAIRLFFVLLTPLAEAAAELPTMNTSFVRSWRMVFVFPVLERFW